MGKSHRRQGRIAKKAIRTVVKAALKERQKSCRRNFTVSKDRKRNRQLFAGSLLLTKLARDLAIAII